jgi:hypothetical protein
MSPRLYQGPRQEKQFRKERQLLLREQDVGSIASDKQSTALAVIPTQEAPKAVPRVVVSRSNLSLVFLAYSLGVVGLGINAWFAYNRGTTAIDKGLLSFLGLTTEAMAFYLPNQASTLWTQRRWLMSVFASILYLVLFVSALINGLGFASLNLADTSTVRSERITPAILDAQRRLDTLTTSRNDECQKRGDKCRQLEKDVQAAFETLREARREVSATADPQIASAAKLVAWVSLNRFHPSADDFAMLRLLLLTLLPQLGGLVLMASSTVARN